MKSANDNSDPTAEDILETKWTVTNHILNKKSIEAVKLLLKFIYGRQVAQPYNRMIANFSESSPLIAIAGDGAIIQYAVPHGEPFDRNNLYDVVAYTEEGRYTIFDVVGRGWDDGEWLRLRREAARPLTLELTFFAADLMDGTDTVCEIPRSMSAFEVSCIVCGYVRRGELDPLGGFIV